MINVAAILDHHAAVRPDKVALAWRSGHYTYAQLLERVNAVAAALADRGIRESDHVALLMQNTPEFIETIYAVNRLGAAFLPINFRLAPAEWRHRDAAEQAAAFLIGKRWDPAHGGDRQDD